MPADFSTWAAHVRRLLAALACLEPEAAAVGVPSPAGSEWFELLRHKLAPQLELRPLLVVAVVGGTNIGKSVIFNQLAGETASAASPLAAGTKHPVCLVPEELADPALLGRLFESFRLLPWQSPQDPLRDDADNLLFWRVGAQVPPRLALLDTPDVDSDALVNWQRARAIRQAADVLLAVLTQQKYNDAAVKQFFREAVVADKPIIVVFNQCDLVADRPYWPLWLATFCQETGARPELIYVLPLDRAAAEAQRLPFYEVGPEGTRPPEQPAPIRDELAALRFDAIKIRTFRGAIDRVLDDEHGAGGYLRAIRAAAAQFAAAAAAISASEMARVAWPSLPPSALVDEIRDWWDAGRSQWSRQIHGFYRTVGRGVVWPVRTAWETLSGSGGDPLENFHHRELDAVLLAVEKMLDELTRLSQVGNDTLRPRLLALLGGNAREQLLTRVAQAHAQLPAVDDDYRRFLRGELDSWRALNPRAVAFLRSLDHVAAIARPAITVSLAVSGWMVAGGLVGNAAAQALHQTAGHLATEAVITGGITGGGEALVSSTGEGVRHAAARLFLRLQNRYAQQRAAWLASWLEREMLGDLLAELHRGAEVPQNASFRSVQGVLAELVGVENAPHA
jgi:hypothetical protein